MKNSAAFIIPMLFIAFQSSAHSQFIDGINDSFGWLAQAARKMMGIVSNTPLKPENEAFARDIAKKMNIRKTIHFYALDRKNGIGNHCSYNRIYLDEKELFGTHGTQKEVASIVIGHELMHAEQCHCLSIYGLFLISYISLGRYLTKVFSHFEVRKKIEDTGVPLLGLLVDKVCPVWIALGLGRLMIGPWAKSYEREADFLAMKRLTPSFGAGPLARGMAIFLSKNCDFKPYSRWEAWFATHPHPKERLRYMGLSEQDTDYWADMYISELKTCIIKMVDKIYLYRVYVRDQEASNLSDSVQYVFFKGMMSLKHLCSIHPSSARKVSAVLEGEELKVFLRKVCRFIADPSQSLDSLTDFSKDHRSLLQDIAWYRGKKEAAELHAEIEQTALVSFESCTKNLHTLFKVHCEEPVSSVS